MMELKKNSNQPSPNWKSNGARPGLTEGSARTVDELVAVRKRRILNEKDDIQDSKSGWSHCEDRNPWGKTRRVSVPEVVDAINCLQKKKALDHVTCENREVRDILRELDGIVIDETIKGALVKVL
jgi:hypothetical protein